MKLTAAQEKFCQCLEIQGTSQRQAYITAYPAASLWKPESVDAKACNLAATDKVKTRCAELRKQQETEIRMSAKWEREDAVKQLKTIIARVHEEWATNEKMTGPQVSAYINAIKELNALYKLYDPARENEGKLSDILAAVSKVI